MKESPYSYLMGLAVTDLALLVLSFIESVFVHRFGSSVAFWQMFYSYFFFPVGNMLANCSVWITVLLTLERWFSVKFPLKAKDLCTRSLARTTTVITGIVSIIINIPRFFCKRPTYNETTTSWESVPTEFQSGDFYTGMTWFYTVLIHIIPFVTLLTLNTYLLVLVYRARTNRELLTVSRVSPQEHSVNREQMRLTITCMSIIVLFLVCIVPSAISQPPVAHRLFGRGKTAEQFHQEPFYRVLRVVTNLLVYCNLSLNFVLYCMFNNKFTRTLKQLVVNGNTCTVRCHGIERRDDFLDRRSYRLSTSSTYSARPSVASKRRVSGWSQSSRCPAIAAEQYFNLERHAIKDSASFYRRCSASYVTYDPPSQQRYLSACKVEISSQFASSDILE